MAPIISQLLELDAGQRGGRFLFAAAHHPRFRAGAEVMPRLAIGADDDARTELIAEPPPPEFERAGGRPFEVIVMRVDVQKFHGFIACVIFRRDDETP